MSRLFSDSTGNSLGAPDHIVANLGSSPWHAFRIEQRRHPRRRPPKETGLGARFKLGLDASIIDLSAGGVLLETRQRLCPGTILELRLFDQDSIATVQGLVLRSAVSRLRLTAVWYRSAIRFEQPLVWPAKSLSRPSASLK